MAIWLEWTFTGNVFSGWFGLFLIVLFTVNAGFSGTRLGLCWVILEEKYPEFHGEIRDPYPTIGEKAVGRWGRMVSTLCISLTLYGGGCVFIVLISQLTKSMFGAAGVELSLCLWMVIVAAVLIPLTWMGTPKDFWPIAVGALITTVTACILIIVQSVMDYQETTEEIEYPAPTLMGSFKAFASIMFAFAGASTFPTIQADMKQRHKFHFSAIMAMAILLLIYFPLAFAGYFSYGASTRDNIVLSISNGPLKITAEVMLLLHLVAAFPIITNPPAQHFEHMLNIPSEFNWKRCAFRTVSVLVLLFVAETIPSFGSILDLVGASTVTLLTFVFPPYFYMKLCDSTRGCKDMTTRHLPVWERIYCWMLIVLGFIGGCCATYTACKNIFSTEFQMPCYLSSGNITVEVAGH